MEKQVIENIGDSRDRAANAARDRAENAARILQPEFAISSRRTPFIVEKLGKTET